MRKPSARCAVLGRRSRVTAGALAGGLALLLLLPLSASAALFAGGTVTLTFNSAFKSELKTAGVKVSVGGGATKAGSTITLPLGEGFGDMAFPDTGHLRADKDATITFKRGSRKVVEGRFRLDSDAADNVAEIFGRSSRERETRGMFISADSVVPFPGFFGLKGTGSAKLTESFSDLLDVRLRTNEFGKGDRVGTWTLVEAPRTGRFTGGGTVLLLNGAASGKLARCGVLATPDHPASYAGAPFPPMAAINFPVSSGKANFSPVTSGLSKEDKKPTDIDGDGGVDLVQSSRSKTLHVDKLRLEVKGEDQTVSASINGGERTNVATFAKEHGPPTVALSASAGSVSIPGEARIRAELVTVLNATFGCSGGDTLGVGDSLGTTVFDAKLG
jgi:hypothetical protein